MKALKSARIVAASLCVLAFGALAASPAMAFDKVDWSWNKDVTEDVDIDAYIDLDIDTTGMVEVEKLQIYLGDVEATSEVFCVVYDVCRDVSSVISSATAIANLQVITSDVPVYLHDAQLLADADYLSRCSEFDELLANAGKGAGNLHTDLALAFTYGAVNGDLKKADIDATSTVAHIENATVDSSATAIGNLISVDLQSDLNNTCESGCEGKFSNHVVIADITQFAYADINATSTVRDVQVDNEIVDGTAIVSSVATAIGNAVIINVGTLD